MYLYRVLFILQEPRLSGKMSNIHTGNLASTAAKLLDFDQKLDIALLDNIITCMYNGTGEEVGSFHDCL